MSQKSTPQISFESSSRGSIVGPPKSLKTPPKNLVLSLFEKNQSKVYKATIKRYKKLEPLPFPEKINEDLSWYENVKTKVGIYSGNMTKAYTFHGFGALLKENGSVYEGNFRMHQPNGFGRLIDTDGTVYEGRWINDTIIGHGKIISNEFVYDGELESNTPNGRGIKISDEGKYIGEFKKGLKHGYGEFTYANECVYKGNFKNDKREGPGKLITSDGIFEGNWHNDMLNGEGTFKNTEFNYNGDFVDDVRQGYGVMVWNDGRKYQGEWKSNMMHGDGAYVDENGNEFKGRWRKSQLKRTESSIKKKQYAEGVFGSESERSSEAARSPPSNALASSVEEILAKVSKMTDEENFMSPKSEGVISRASFKPNMDIPKNKLAQAKELTDDSVSFNFEELKTSYYKEYDPNTKDAYEDELIKSQIDQKSSDISGLNSNQELEESQTAFKIPLENPLLAEDLSFRMKKQEVSSFLMSEKEEDDPKISKKGESGSDWNFRVSEEEKIVKRKHKKHIKSSSEEEKENPFEEASIKEDKKKKKNKVSIEEEGSERIESEEVVEISQSIDEIGIQDKQEFEVIEKEEEIAIEYGNQNLEKSDEKKIKTKKHRNKKKITEESEEFSEGIITEKPLELSDAGITEKPLEISDVEITEKKKNKKKKQEENEFTTPGEIEISHQSGDEPKTSKKKKRKHKNLENEEEKNSNEDIQSLQVAVEDSFALGKIRHKELEESDIISLPGSDTSEEIESSRVSNQSSRISEAPKKSNKSSNSEEKSSVKSQSSNKSNKSSQNSSKSNKSSNEEEKSQNSGKSNQSSDEEEQSHHSSQPSKYEEYGLDSARSHEDSSEVEQSQNSSGRQSLNSSVASSQKLETENIDSDIEFGQPKIEESPSQSVSIKSSFQSQAPLPLNDSEVNISADESSTKWIAPMHEPSLDETPQPVHDISLPDTPLPSNSTNLNNFMLPKSPSDMKFSSLEENVLVQKDEESDFQTEKSSVTAKSDVKNEEIDESFEKETDERIIKLKSVHFPHEERKDFELLLSVRNSLAPFSFQDPDFRYPKVLPEFCEWKEIGPGIYYYGEWTSRNQRCGRGIEIFYNQVYEGFWKNNKRNGLGRVVTKEGDIYEGYWVNNVKCGFGVLTKYDGQTYIGDWFLDTPNGLGYEDDKNEIYSGQVKYAMRHGKGFLQMRDGATYEGEFFEDKVHGRGILRREDGTVYDGHFVDGKIKGSGEEVPNYNLKVKIPRIKDLTTKDIALEIEKPRKSAKY